jgi:hypothetical protein
MALSYAIDRFDGRDWVVLEDDAARTFHIPRSWVPAEAQEGDVLTIDTQDSATATALHITIDRDATARRRRQAEEIRQRLPRGPKGDVSL